MTLEHEKIIRSQVPHHAMPLPAQGISLPANETGDTSPLIAVCQAYGISHHDRAIVHEQLLLLAGQIHRRCL